jgi:hypothetical protein
MVHEHPLVLVYRESLGSPPWLVAGSDDFHQEKCMNGFICHNSVCMIIEFAE